MRTRHLVGIMSAAVIAGLVVIPAAAANAATPATGAKVVSAPVMIRQSDFIPALSDTRSSGHLQFIKDGLHVWTDDNTGQAKVAEYFKVSGSLADMVGSTVPVWWGTTNAPGSQIVFDADGTGGTNKYNILVGEAVYGGNDWWLTNGSSTLAHSVCPSTSGGSGSACHGTLAQWAAALPNAKVQAGGFSLGSGVLGQGLLYSQTFGTTEYHFTNLPAIMTSTMTVAPRVVVYGQLAVASGTVRKDGVGTPGVLVTFSRLSGKTWVAFGATKSDAHGNWKKALVPPATWTIRATATGYPSPTAVVTVTSRVSVKALGRTLYVGVSPKLVGKRVVLQIQVGKIWRNVTTATLSKTSTAAFKVTKGGVYHVIALAVPGYATGVSASIKIK